MPLVLQGRFSDTAVSQALPFHDFF